MGSLCDRDKGNPFLPYDEALWVTHVSETHTVLLNKFNLVDRHVLVVTREFEHQDSPLTLNDISATWTTLKVEILFGNEVLNGVCSVCRKAELRSLIVDRCLEQVNRTNTLKCRSAIESEWRNWI